MEMIAQFLANLLHFLLVAVLGLFGLSVDQGSTDRDSEKQQQAVQLEQLLDSPVTYVLPSANRIHGKCGAVKPEQIHTVKTPLLMDGQQGKLVS